MKTSAEKLFIKNRKGQKVCIMVEQHEAQRGLAFVMHGLSGTKEQPHITIFAEAFKKNGFTVVRFDTTSTFGESDGNYEDATTTNYYEDLEDVIEASTLEAWYQEPFWLAGHSVGGMCVALYAQYHPKRVAGVAPVSTVVSGTLSLQTKSYEAQNAVAWKQSGWLEGKSETRPGITKRLKWGHMEDRMKYDLLRKADKMTMPVLMIVGEQDDGTPPEHQSLLFEKLPGPKELHLIKDAPHTFKEREHLAEISEIFSMWIKKNSTMSSELRNSPDGTFLSANKTRVADKEVPEVGVS